MFTLLRAVRRAQPWSLARLHSSLPAPPPTTPSVAQYLALQQRYTVLGSRANFSCCKSTSEPPNKEKVDDNCSMKEKNCSIVKGEAKGEDDSASCPLEDAGECSDSCAEDKLPVKECSDAESSEQSEAEEDNRLAASELCGCVKEAVAAAVAAAKPKQEVKKTAPCGAPKPEVSSKPKVSEHVSCCKTETSKSGAGSGGSPCGSRCETDKEGGGRKDTNKSGGESVTGEGKQGDSKGSDNKTCACIKQAISTCEKGGTSGAASGKDKTPTTEGKSKGKEDASNTTEGKQCSPVKTPEKGKQCSTVARPDKKGKQCSSVKSPDKKGKQGSSVKAPEKKGKQCSSVKTPDKKGKQCSSVKSPDKKGKQCSSVKTPDKKGKQCSSVNTPDKKVKQCSSVKKPDEKARQCSSVRSPKEEGKQCSPVDVPEKKGKQCSSVNVDKKGKQCSPVKGKQCSSVKKPGRGKSKGSTGKQCSPVGTSGGKDKSGKRSQTKICDKDS